MPSAPHGEASKAGEGGEGGEDGEGMPGLGSDSEEYMHERQFRKLLKFVEAELCMHGRSTDELAAEMGITPSEIVMWSRHAYLSPSMRKVSRKIARKEC